MSKISRRALARYAAQKLIDGKPASEIAASLASVMIELDLTREVEFLLGDIAWELEQRGELATTKVTSAKPLGRELEKQLAEQIKKAAKTQAVTIQKIIDKSVIGGIKVETAGRVWDKTIRRQLTQLREVF